MRCSISCMLVKLSLHVMSRVSKLLTTLPQAITYFLEICIVWLSVSGTDFLSMEQTGTGQVVTMFHYHR